MSEKCRPQWVRCGDCGHKWIGLYMPIEVNRPLTPMTSMKLREHGVSYGMAEAGYDLRIKQAITLHPLRRFAIASTIERLKMPENLVAIIHDKSTWARRGLSVFNTVIEPGWRGWLTLELIYHGWKPLHIPSGAGIAQAIFHRLKTPARYGSGKYQDQPDRPVEAIADAARHFIDFSALKA